MSESGNNKAEGSEIYEEFRAIMQPGADLMPVYGVRAEIRNAQRSWLERSTLLTDFLDLPSFPAVTGEDIEAEYEQEIQRRKDSMIESGDDDLVDDVRNAVRSEIVACILSRDMEREERGKYIVKKIIFYLKKGKLEKARKVYGCASARNKNDDGFLELLSSEAGDLVIDYFLHLIEKKKYDEAVDAFYGLGLIKAITKEDLEGVEFSEQEKAMLLGLFEDELNEAFNVHPSAYLAVRKSLEESGLYGEAIFDSLINAEEKIKNALVGALRIHPIVYMGLLCDFEKAGLVDADTMNNSECMQDEMKKCLARCLAIAPRVYFEMRDRFEKYGLLEADEADCSSYVLDELKTLLRVVIEKYPEFYEWMKLKMKWKGLYLSEEQEEKMDTEYESEQEKMNGWSFGWALGDVHRKKEVKLMKLNAELEGKYQKWADEFGLDDEQHRLDYARIMQRAIVGFLNKYPQYENSVNEFNLLQLPTST